MRRRSREHGFEPSLLGDLNRALSQVDHHISLARRFQWWFLLPALLVLLLDLALFCDSKPVWNWPVTAVGLAVGTRLARIDLQCVHLPNKSDLESLRTKLMASG